jgi:hypothetical protein
VLYLYFSIVLNAASKYLCPKYSNAEVQIMYFTSHKVESHNSSGMTIVPKNFCWWWGGGCAFGRTVPVRDRTVGGQKSQKHQQNAMTTKDVVSITKRTRI